MNFMKLLATVGFLVGMTPSCRCVRQETDDGTKKVYNYRNEGTGKSLDPQYQYDQYSTATVRLLFDSLYNYHYLKRPYELVPNLATGLPTFSDHGKVMTISVRNDVRFHDDPCFEGGKGRILTAKDVLYTIKRYGDSNVNLQGSNSLVEGMIEGFDDYVARTKTPEGKGLDYDAVDISGLKLIDDFTLEIRLTKPTPVVFYVLGTTYAAIVAKECVQKYGEDIGFHPVGTGPFLMTYRNRKGDYVFKKNPNYHGRYPSEGEPGDAEKGLLVDAGKQLPLVDEVVVPVIEEPQPAMLKFLRGYFDWVRIDADSFRDMAVKTPDGKFELKPPFDKKYELFPGMDLGTSWMALNMKDPVIGGKNVKLRKAIAHAINRQGYVDDVYNGRGEVVSSMIPTAIQGHGEQVGVDWYPYDVAKAKQLLVEAGYPGGNGLPTLKYYYASSPTLQKQFEYIRRNLDAVGIKIELESEPYSAYVTKFSKGGFQISLCGWSADYLDAENFLFLFTKSALDSGLYYGAGWTNPEYETLMGQVRETPNGPERLALIKRMLEILKEDVPYIPVFTYNRLGMKAPWLKNFKRDKATESEAIYVDIDLERRRKGYEK